MAELAGDALRAHRQLPPRRRRGGARGDPARVRGAARGRLRGRVARRRSRRVRPGSFHGAISHPRRRLDPAGALRPAARGARGRGRAPSSASTTRSRTSTALDADRVLVATDGYGHGLVPELADLDLADPRPGDRERAARPRALRPPALRAPGLRLLAAAARRPDRARRLPRRLDPRRAHGRRGDDAGDPGVARVVPPRARRRGGRR